MSDTESRAYTKEEMREMLMYHLNSLHRYWASEVTGDYTVQQRLEGMLHSILCVFDGSTSLPAFDITPSPHPDDEEFHKEEGENWWPDDVVLNDDVHLHDLIKRG